MTDIPEDRWTEAALRERYGAVSPVAERKVLTRLDRHARHFIALSPFLVLGSSRPDGGGDVSPRGDPPGFVHVIDETTLIVPDRPGNRRIDTFRNLAVNPAVAMIFFVPGIDETLRVNGRATYVADAARLAPLEVAGKAPLGGIAVAVEEVFFHCAKALIRSKLWDPETRIARKSFPSLGRIIADQVAGVDGETADQSLEKAYAATLY